MRNYSCNLLPQAQHGTLVSSAQPSLGKGKKPKNKKTQNLKAEMIEAIPAGAMELLSANQHLPVHGAGD